MFVVSCHRLRGKKIKINAPLSKQITNTPKLPKRNEQTVEKQKRQKQNQNKKKLPK